MSLTNVPFDGRPRCEAAGVDRGLPIAARSALYADAFSATGGTPWAGRLALPPATDTDPPDSVPLGTILTIACGPGVLPPTGAAWASPAPETRTASVKMADRAVTRRNPITPPDRRPRDDRVPGPAQPAGRSPVQSPIT